MSQPHLWSVSGGGDSRGHQQKGPRLERGNSPTLPACGQEDLHQPGQARDLRWGCPVPPSVLLEWLGSAGWHQPSGCVEGELPRRCWG